MTVVHLCDRPECMTTAPAGVTPAGWVAQGGRLYCTPRCATLVPGGAWPGDPVVAAYDAALAGEPVDVTTIEPRSLKVEVLEASLRGEADRPPVEPDPPADGAPVEPPAEPEPDPEPAPTGEDTTEPAPTEGSTP